MEINTIIRENIRNLQPYSCARDEWQGDAAILLDANENPYNTGYNRYPDPYQRELKKAVSRLKGVVVEQIILGNGSDEIIDLLIRSVCEPGVDNLIVFSPGYSMYEVSAAINNVEVRKINLTSTFLPDWVAMGDRMDDRTKIVFLCTPNNPTGKVIPIDQIEDLCRRFSGLVVVDEAYIDFTNEVSATVLLAKYPNVVVLQTFSKSWGMAGLRLGMCFANQELVEVLNRVKAPYNISGLTQKMALEILMQKEEFTGKLERIKKERERLTIVFRRMALFENVYISEANFILVICRNYQALYDYLIKEGVIVRLRNVPPLIEGGVRISIGTEKENDRLLDLLRRFDMNF